MEWKEFCPKAARRPTVEVISEYLGENNAALFGAFTNSLRLRMSLGYVKPAWSETHGWTLQFGHSGLLLLKNVRFENHCFYVNEKPVNAVQDLSCAIAHVEGLYHDGFKERLAAYSHTRGKAQKARTERRKAREQAEKGALPEVNSERLNKCRWAPLVSRVKIKRLYESDAKGFADEALADEIGVALYARCHQGREVTELRAQGKLRCPDCETILPFVRGLMQCACGWQCFARDYFRNFRAANMPTNSAAPLFNRFLADWPQAKSYTEKMFLIDWLIHQFHNDLLSGSRGRSVAGNLISGSKAEVGRLLFSLAHGDAAEREHTEWLKSLNESEQAAYAE